MSAEQRAEGRKWRRRRIDGAFATGGDWPALGGSVYEDADGRWLASTWRPRTGNNDGRNV